MDDAKEEIEYCYDGEGNRYEVSSGFKLVRGEGRCVSCPVCQACVHLQIGGGRYRVSIDDFMCGVLGGVPEDVLNSKTFHCAYFQPDEKSLMYDFVMREIEGRA